MVNIETDFNKLKDEFVDSNYWDIAFNIAYRIKDEDLSSKEMCVTSALNVIKILKQTGEL